MKKSILVGVALLGLVHGSVAISSSNEPFSPYDVDEVNQRIRARVEREKKEAIATKKKWEAEAIATKKKWEAEAPLRAARAKEEALREREQERLKNEQILIQREIDKKARDQRLAEEAIKNTPPKIGMTEAQVRRGKCATPYKINRTQYRWGAHEQWVCDADMRLMVYLENGVVTAIQD